MKRIIHWYAEETIDGNESLHRFGNKSERDGWVSGDTRHRRVIIRDDVMRGRTDGRWRDVFKASAHEIAWSHANGHEVMGTRHEERVSERPDRHMFETAMDVSVIELELGIRINVLREVICYMVSNDGEMEGGKFDFVIFSLENLAESLDRLGDEVTQVYQSIKNAA